MAQAEIKHRIRDQLARAVIGDIASAVHFHHVDAHLRKRVPRRQQVRFGSVTPKREHRSMLEQKYRLTRVARLDKITSRDLRIVGLVVRDRSLKSDTFH